MLIIRVNCFLLRSKPFQINWKIQVKSYHVNINCQLIRLICLTIRSYTLNHWAQYKSKRNIILQQYQINFTTKTWANATIKHYNYLRSFMNNCSSNKTESKLKRSKRYKLAHLRIRLFIWATRCIRLKIMCRLGRLYWLKRRKKI